MRPMHAHLWQSPERILGLLGVALLPMGGGCGEHTLQGHMPQPSRLMGKPVVGAETNGFYARVSLYLVPELGELPSLDVDIVGTVALTNAAKLQPRQPNRMPESRYIYYVLNVAGRYLPGPMELRDGTGHVVLGLGQNPASAGSFPATLRLIAILAQQTKEEGHWKLKMPVSLVDSTNALPLLGLQDLFPVQKPGKYELTIFPKIYKKSETDGDLLKRIDLMPVTVDFTYEARR